MKRMIMLNSHELPVIGTLYFQVTKFMSSFRVHGYDVLEINSIENLIELHPSRDDIVYVSDHGISISLENSQRAFEKLSKLHCVFILWFYHNVIEKLQMPEKWILTGEHFRRPPKVHEHLACWELQQLIPNYVPMTFATAILPENIGMYPRDEILKASFVGAPYQVDWCRELTNKDSKILVRYTPPFISEEDRLRIYLASVVSLGFHSPNNSANSVIVERVFEGLALGNVVISDNPACEEFTDGNVKHVNKIEDVKDEIEKCWIDPVYRKARQSSGMKWCKDNGTYVNVSRSFINKINELWERT